jgi:hypothetical protein
MNVELPENIPFKGWLQFENGYSHVYGALHVAANYCGLSKTPETFNGVWLHGCSDPWENRIFPESIAYNVPKIKDINIYVARKDEADSLRAIGCHRVMAIGLPLVYLNDVIIKRHPGNLLVLPVHHLPEGGNSLIKEYAHFIKSIEHKFNETIVCLHNECSAKNMWINQFEMLGIRCIRGASYDDANSLLRTKYLFSQFEFVTTNDWGSHVAYALSCGAKVSISGLTYKYSIEDYLADPGYGGNIDKITQLVSSESMIREKKEMIGKLYVSPENGVTDTLLGDWFIGRENKISPVELKGLFDWNSNNLSENNMISEDKMATRYIQKGTKLKLSNASLKILLKKIIQRLS